MVMVVASLAAGKVPSLETLACLLLAAATWLPRRALAEASSPECGPVKQPPMQYGSGDYVLLQTSHATGAFRRFGGVASDFFEDQFGDAKAQQEDKEDEAASGLPGVHLPQVLPLEASERGGRQAASHVASQSDASSEVSDWGGLRTGLEAGLWMAAEGDKPSFKLPKSMTETSDTSGATVDIAADDVDRSGLSLSALAMSMQQGHGHGKHKAGAAKLKKQAAPEAEVVVQHHKKTSVVSKPKREQTAMPESDLEGDGAAVRADGAESGFAALASAPAGQNNLQFAADSTDSGTAAAATGAASSSLLSLDPNVAAPALLPDQQQQAASIPVEYQSDMAAPLAHPEAARLAEAGDEGMWQYAAAEDGRERRTAGRIPTGMALVDDQVAVSSESSADTASCWPYCNEATGAAVPPMPYVNSNAVQSYAVGNSMPYMDGAALYASQAAAAQPFFGPQVGGCTPQCTWKCDVPRCDETCEPVCKAPRCETRCQGADFKSCAIDCQEPHCAVVCPQRTCPTGGCPMCSTTCSEPTCQLKCPGKQRCYNVCEQPDCEWKCTPPTDCPAPSCHMVCQQPPNCAGGTYRQLPPVQPWETTVQHFSGAANNGTR